ncbi:MAG: hypothetical protein FWC77_07825 [Defluviitaleaceae bacterium]|nr:hypothetical protein [Defluviitaleaceae bacterium]
MLFKYMKMHRRVILILLIAAVLVAAVRLAGSREPEREFQGTFIRAVSITL